MQLVVEYQCGGDEYTCPPLTVTACIEYESAEAFIVGFEERLSQQKKKQKEARESLEQRDICKYINLIQDTDRFAFAGLIWDTDSFKELPDVYELQEWFKMRLKDGPSY